MPMPPYSPFIQHWNLDTQVVFLNHGSFGACPTEVLQKQAIIQSRLEAEPVRFMVEELEPIYRQAKISLADFVGTHTNNISFVPNTTTGVNTVLNSLPTAQPNEEWLLTNLTYGACAQAAQHYARLKGYSIVTAQLPFPFTHEDELVQALEQSITPNTKFAIIDFVTSATGFVLPVDKIIKLVHTHGVQVLIDAAHAPGMVNFNLDQLQPDYFVGNCHKWICSPKGSAFLYVAKAHQHQIFPLVISHQYDKPVAEEEKWCMQFFWDGTHDFSAFLCVPAAIDFMGQIAGGWNELRAQNKALTIAGRSCLNEVFGFPFTNPESNVGHLANIEIPPATEPLTYGFNNQGQLKNLLMKEYKIEVPIIHIGNRRYVRISAQLYNSLEQYQYLADVLTELKNKNQLF